MKKKSILCFSIYKLFLDILFIKGSSVQLAYLNRTLDFNVIKYIVGWIVFLIIINLIHKIKRDTYRFMIKSIFLLSGTSNISIFGLRNYDVKYFMIILTFWILMIVLCIIFSKNKETTSSDMGILNNETSNYINIFLMILGVVITLYEVHKFGINVSSLSQLYNVREFFRAQSISTLDSYLMSWNATVILPWCFLIAFKSKKYLRCGLILFFALLMFEINGMKTWLMIYAIIIAFVFLTKRYDLDASINIILIGVSFFIAFGLLLFWLTDSYALISLLDRTIILPGEINYYYLDFFSENELLYLRESIFKHFSSSPYNPLSAVQISMKNMTAAYYHNATNGLIGDMYGNFGFMGILFYPFMIMLSYSVLDNVTNKYSNSVRAVILFILMWSLINTSFFTWIMTGGYLIYIIILTLNKKIFLKLKI